MRLPFWRPRRAGAGDRHSTVASEASPTPVLTDWRDAHRSSSGVEVGVQHGLFSDVDLHVEDSGGTGRPVVLVHGWPLSSQVWRGQVEAFKGAGYRVIRYDRRGFGRSDKPRSGYDIDTLTADLARVIEAFDLREVTLIGSSTGEGRSPATARTSVRTGCAASCSPQRHFQAC